jgi:hypothetical protein
LNNPTLSQYRQEFGLPDLSASTATDSLLVGEDPLSHGGEIILDFEILRMSSPHFKQRRRQSPSPDSQRRLLTPTEEDSTPSKKMHTPRKNTHIKLSKIA